MSHGRGIVLLPEPGDGQVLREAASSRQQAESSRQKAEGRKLKAKTGMQRALASSRFSTRDLEPET